MPQIKALFAQLKEVFLKLDKSKRIVVAGTAGATFLLLVAVVFWASRKDFEVLYSQMDPQEAGVVVQKLKADKIPFRLTSGGTTILVPRKKVYEVRLSLASQGLPEQGGVGYEIFDKNNIGATDFVQKINYQRALEGELARTISSLNEVKRARVHLVLPDESLFVEDQKPTTASVTLLLKPGRRLNDGQVRGIANLVSASVEGLKPQNVTIVDSNGNILSRILQKDDTAGLTATQIALQKNVEKYYAGKVQSLLETVVGTGKATVRVSADLDFNKVQQTVEKYSPDTTVIRSVETNYQITPGDTLKGTGGKVENRIQNYEINKTIQNIIRGVGTIRRLSVAVMVDGKYISAKGKNGQPVQQYVPRSPQEMTKLTSVVKSAIGYDAKRGDVVNVVNIAFDHSAFEKEQMALVAAEKRARVARMIRSGLYGLAGVVALFALWKILRSFRTEIQPLDEEEIPFGNEDIAQEIPTEIQRKIQIQQKVANLSTENPEEAAKLLKAWIVEEVTEDAET